MTPRPDPRPEIRRLAREAGVVLPDQTVDELTAHLDDVYDEACEEGATPDEAVARVRATLAESGVDPLRRHAALAAGDACRQSPTPHIRYVPTRSLNLMHAVATAVRQLRQARGVAVIAVIVLGLGVGTAAAVFTVVDTVVLTPLPFRAPDRLVTLWDTNSDKGLAHDPISPVTFMDYRALPVFSDGAAWWRPGINLVDPGQDPVRVNTIEVSANLFEVLGVGPQIGEGFPAGGPLHDRTLVAVISDRLWRSRYSGDPAILGRPLSLNGRAYTVVGVMPSGFHFPDDVDVWQRLQWDLTQHSREAHFMEAVLRLSPGTSLTEAQTAVDTLAGRLQTEFVASNAGWGARVVPLLDEQLGAYQPALLVLLGAVGLLLAIAVLNVASLLVARAVARGREMAVRVALGATARHLVTQLLAESLVLSAAGATLGVATSAALLPLVIGTMPVAVPRLEGAAIDLRTIAACLLVISATTLIFGLVPAVLVLGRRQGSDLKAGDRGSSSRGRRIQAALVATEVALACALLASSALLIQTVRAMVEVPTGVDANDVLAVPIQIQPPRGAGGTRDRATWMHVASVHAQLLEAIRQQPGVTAAGASNFLPMMAGWRNPFAIDGEAMPARPEDLPQVQMHSVSDGYFETMAVVVTDGRAFTAFDSATSLPVVLVNDAFVRRFMSKGRAVGRTLRMWSAGIGPLGVNLTSEDAIGHGGLPFEIVGVVRDVANGAIGQPVEPAMYYSTRQFPFAEVFVAVKASDRATALAAVHSALRAVAPNVPMGTAGTWGERVAAATAHARLLMAILVGFGGLASILAAVGVYGLCAWSVARQRRELAIRLTLGARPGAIGVLVVRHVVVLVVVGLGAGMVLVRLADSVLARVLFGVTAGDTVALTGAAALLVVAAVAACVPPAVAAMRVDPVEGLRTE